MDEYEPIEEGLDKVVDTRSVSVIEIKLSKDCCERSQSVASIDRLSKSGRLGHIRQGTREPFSFSVRHVSHRAN